MGNHSNPVTMSDSQKREDIIVVDCISRTAIIKGDVETTDISIELDHINSFDEQLQAICDVLQKMYEEKGEETDES